MSKTRLTYMYRDASNYKYRGASVLSGGIDEELAARLSSSLESSEFFIATQIRVSELFPSDWPLEQDDHCWHVLSDIESTDEEPDDRHGRTIAEFVDEVERVSREGWRVSIQCSALLAGGDLR